MTVSKLCQLYLAWHASVTSATTHYHRSHFIRRFVQAYGDRLVEDAKAHWLSEWILSHDRWGDSSRWHARTSVCAAWNFGIDQELILRNPFKRIRFSPGLPRRECTAAEFRSLIRATAAVPGWHDGATIRRMLYLMRWLGLRTAELCGMSWDEVQGASLVLRAHKTFARTRRPRVVPLVGPARALLLALPRRAPTVFVNSRGRPWTVNAFQRRFRTLRQVAGVSDDCVPYSLRHSFGTVAIENGVDLLSVSKLMGHSSTRMTERYCHLNGEFLRQQMRRAMG